LFNLEEETIIGEVSKRKCRRVLLQVPEGLRPNAFQLARLVESRTSAEAIISADPCYGSCDLALSEASALNADLIVHVGHSKPLDVSHEKCLFIEARASVDVKEAVRKALMHLDKEQVIGICSVIQHIGELERAKCIVEEAGKTALIGKADQGLTYDGQILGCRLGAVKSISSKVDAFLVLAGGDFHGLGVRIATGKRTIVSDPFQGQARDMEHLARRFLRKRYAAIDCFRKARKVGILLGLKTGQLKPATAAEVRTTLEKRGYQCVLLALREIDPTVLENFPDIEGFVSTACPRVAWDDQDRFRKPVVNPEEAFIAVGLRRWEDYTHENSASKRN
jgi:2-(3-amino-3-carboxypropyl)histidine synthase